MKIKTLFLKAFGPFKDVTLDFSGPSNLHLIYGPNEAGKSSALRAIGDLRYGFHGQSKDGFGGHDLGKQPLAATFLDIADRPIGLARRKGLKNTLTFADPETGLALTDSAIGPEIELALTGGIDKDKFWTMYGINSASLRKGGQALINGDGDLGSILFQASTGSDNINGVVAALKADIKRYFGQGNAPLLKALTLQLDAAKQRYKQAVTRPEQWTVLNNAHTEAKAQLVETRENLIRLRRQLAEWVELRAVEPLIRDLDQAQTQWDAVQGNIELPAESRQQRLAATQSKSAATGMRKDAQEKLVSLEAKLDALHIEKPLLAHAVAIDRHTGDLALVRSQRKKRIELEATTTSVAERLAAQAKRMTAASDVPFESISHFYLRTPDAATRAEIGRVIEKLQRLENKHDNATEKLGTAKGKLTLRDRGVVQAPTALQQQALVAALAQAQEIATASNRLPALEVTETTEQRALERDLADLGMADLETLRRSRPFDAAEIDAHVKSVTKIEAQLASLADKRRAIETDSKEQQRRLTALAAEGEIVTADTLKQARGSRDQNWKTIRKAFIALDGGAAEALPKGVDKFALPEVFEKSSSEADRQADLLREGAARAAEAAVCEHRIKEMRDGLIELDREKAAQDDALRELVSAWRLALQTHGIAVTAPASVREWLARRVIALRRLEELSLAQQAQSKLTDQVADASKKLGAALNAVGSIDTVGSVSLEVLIGLGAKVQDEIVAQKTATIMNAEVIEELTAEISFTEGELNDISNKLKVERNALDTHCGRLYLVGASAPEVVTARLSQLQEWTAEYVVHHNDLKEISAMKAVETSALNSANELAAMLGELPPENADAWSDDLVLRLEQSRQSDATRTNLEINIAEARGVMSKTDGKLTDAQTVLADLLKVAGVADVEELPQIEDLSDQKKQAAERLQGFTTQLSKTSRRDLASLRVVLENLDTVAIDQQHHECQETIEREQAAELAAIAAEEASRLALNTVDTSDTATQAREEMESAIAQYRAAVRPCARLMLADVLLGETLRRYRDKAQGPMVELASDYFKLITGGRFVRMMVDTDGDKPVLKAIPAMGNSVEISELSEGTADQLYLALRLAALELQIKPDRMMPLVLDDVFITSDDERSANMFRALAKFAKHSQVMVFTHHSHLTNIATETLGDGQVKRHFMKTNVLDGASA